MQVNLNKRLLGGPVLDKVSNQKDKKNVKLHL